MVKAKRKADGEIIDVSSVEYTNVKTNVKSRYCSKDGKMYPLSDLDFLPEKETATLEGWIVRDGNLFGDDGFLRLFLGSEPYRVADDDLKTWDGEESLRLPDEAFPSVTWQSEPKKVRIKIEEI